MSIDSFEASKRRSDEIRADLSVHPENYLMLTGDRPTGRLHLGHYFGTIRERVALQGLGVRTNIIIADYQVITDRDTTEHIQDNVRNMVIDYLACGVDPEKTMIFTHSAFSKASCSSAASCGAPASAASTSASVGFVLGCGGVKMVQQSS